MSKTGQARVLTPDQFAHLLNVIQEHRYPEKNTALVQISFKFGLRVQEIAMLQIKDVGSVSTFMILTNLCDVLRLWRRLARRLTLRTSILR